MQSFCEKNIDLPEQVREDICRIAERHNLSKVILFGSRARGTNYPRSDIDLAVAGGSPDWFQLDILDDARTLLSFDVINLDRHVSANLLREIEKDGVILYMNTERLTEFSKNLAVLRTADFAEGKVSPIYRMGIIGEFALTFELAWKAMREVLIANGESAAKSGSPRDILGIAYGHELFSDDSLWRTMLKKRNTTIHIYDDNEADELLDLIQAQYIPAFDDLEKNLQDKMNS